MQFVPTKEPHSLEAGILLINKRASSVLVCADDIRADWGSRYREELRRLGRGNMHQFVECEDPVNWMCSYEPRQRFSLEDLHQLSGRPARTPRIYENSPVFETGGLHTPRRSTQDRDRELPRPRADHHRGLRLRGPRTLPSVAQWDKEEATGGRYGRQVPPPAVLNGFELMTLDPACGYSQQFYDIICISNGEVWSLYPLPR